MSQISIAVIVGSLRQDSINRKLAEGLIRLGPPEISFQHIGIGDLPLYNQDHEEAPPTAVTQFRAAIAAVHAVLFVTPEYNRSVPGVLKNALDTGSRPVKQNAWAGKPAGIVGTSPGSVGTAVAQQHLRTVLATLDMPTLNQPEIFIQFKEGLIDADGGIGEGSRKFLQGWMDRYVAFVKKQIV